MFRSGAEARADRTGSTPGARPPQLHGACVEHRSVAHDPRVKHPGRGGSFYLRRAPAPCCRSSRGRPPVFAVDARTFLDQDPSSRAPAPTHTTRRAGLQAGPAAEPSRTPSDVALRLSFGTTPTRRSTQFLNTWPTRRHARTSKTPESPAPAKLKPRCCARRCRRQC